MTREEFIEQECKMCGTQRCYGEEYCGEYQRKVLKKMEYSHPEASVTVKTKIIDSDEEFNDKALIRTLRYQLEQKEKQLEQTEVVVARKIFAELDQSYYYPEGKQGSYIVIYPERLNELKKKYFKNCLSFDFEYNKHL